MMTQEVSVTLTCSNEEACDVVIRMPVVVGGTLPKPPEICTACNRGMLLVSSINPIHVKIDSPSEVARNPAPWTGDVEKSKRQATNIIDAELRTVKAGFEEEWATNEEWVKSMRENGTPVENAPVNNSPGGSGIKSAFDGRASQPIVIMQALKRMSGDKKKGEAQLKVREVIPHLRREFREINVRLSQMEEEVGAVRGELTSDAYPTNEGSFRIAMKSNLGIDIVKESANYTGSLVEAGIVEVIDTDTIMVTEYERVISNVTDISKHILDISGPVAVLGEERPFLPVFFTRDASLEILDRNAMLWPDDDHHNMHVLGLVEKATDQDPESGWNSNTYATEEAFWLQIGNGHPRWGDRFDRYVISAKRRGERRPREIAATKMTNNINSTLGGLIGRLKELGLVHPIRAGAVKNLLITDFGREALALYKEREGLE